MKFSKAILFSCFLSCLQPLFAAPNTIIKDSIIINANLPGAFPLADGSKVAPVYVDEKEEKVVHIVAGLFAKDIESVTGYKPLLRSQKDPPTDLMIIAGTVDQSDFIKKIQSENGLFRDLTGKWETFTICLVDRPFKGVKKALVICGSDKRGLAFGLFELSRRIGVSPLVWWADVVPQKRSKLYFKAGQHIGESPSVKYRGVFLNDEDWGLQPWAARKMDTDIQDIGPNTYAKVFELLLRLKANYIWPAMHPSTKAFWYYKRNAEIAKDYSIILGASHCEPMLRNNVFEWSENFEKEYGKKPGAWRYDVNSREIYTYWEDRVKQASGNEAVYTVGMRGIHDGSMPGPDSIELKKILLEKIITDQRYLLNRYNKGIQVPQIFCPYKEVLDIYQEGLKLPEDITIVWSDDNHGYIRQLSDREERGRKGGSGVYYHLSYWGRPKDYLWLSSISPVLISNEMTKAYQLGADKLWIFNVGDIKPAEAELQFALDLAWNINAWPTEKAFGYTYSWAKETFGENLATEIATIKNEYYHLAASGKPEHILDINFSESEMQLRLQAYKQLFAKVYKIKSKIPETLRAAFFQLIEYPVTGAMLMNEKVLCAKLSWLYANKGDSSALNYSDRSKKAFKEIQRITNVYNKEISAGKWDGMMSWHPREQEVFKMPKIASAKDIKTLQKEPTTPKDEVLKVSPSQFYVTNRRGMKISTVKGLGIAGVGLTVLPVTEDVPKDITQLPFIEYKISGLTEDDYMIQIRALPVFPLYEGCDMGYAISVNNEPAKWVDLKVEADTPAWDKNVLQGYISAKTQSKFFRNKSVNSIKIYFTSPGFVFSNMSLHPLK
ncbi:glycosyl hydrolase 115 family protein [Niabella aurantiaca]|uniref:glycosyl hydrolase 115 family protein n=1 Tax=Niabella aurantiaca TaxID=379900 RepID=UPI00035D8606|nr:glycosyl hydrolase 115 family protein [Niabella aurantiaca]